jgi:2-polyprenyl-3-methyl-5-hydroxy-6-metoxy-1,4-benzoquinol methylase
MSMDTPTAESRTDNATDNSSEKVTFSFGANWQSFVESMPKAAIDEAVEGVKQWLDADRVAGRSVVDVGSGSGIHSLAFLRLGASSVRSFDFDPKSVDATKAVWRKLGEPRTWDISSGSILDEAFTGALGTFDIVYSWGVLHHTGALWHALDQATKLVAPGGCLWVAIYVSGPSYPRHLATKRRYNAASPVVKRVMEAAALARVALSNARRTSNPLKWLPQKERGMGHRHDVKDWLGGLPYEVASADEVVTFCRERGFLLERIKTVPEGSCNSYLFSRT